MAVDTPSPVSYGKEVQEILSTLNKQQFLATTFDPTKALQVIAGPGTGKTKVLTSRVAYLLLHHNIAPRDIIVTTFTNKAAKEMIERLSLMLKNTHVNVNDLIIGTFHGICLRILSRFGDKIGLVPGWRIVEEKEIDTFVNESIEKMPDQIRDYANSFERLVNLCRPIKNGEEWAIHPKMIKKEISKLKAAAILPEEYSRESIHDSALAYFYESYQNHLHKLNALDFDDLLMYCFRLLAKERCLPFIKHVFVDEFQDTNSIQMDLMFLFAKGNHHLSRGITVVGDPDQSIYAFRNALDQNFQQMINKSPLNCSQIVLIENYRSSQKILDTSETLIKQQQRGRTLRAPLHAQFDCEFQPVYINFPVNFIQGPSLAREMLYLKSLPKLFTYNDFAILVRQRRQIKNIETALIEHRIPYKIIRGRAFWELKEVMAMLNLLRCVYSDNEKQSILQSLIYPARGLGQATMEKLKNIMDKEDNNKNNNNNNSNNLITPFHVLENVAEGKVPLNMNNKIKSVIVNFVRMVQICKEKLNSYPSDKSLSSIFDTLYQQSGLEHEYLFEDGKKKKSENSNTSNPGDAQPNYENARHKNVSLLKNYFLGTKRIEELPTESTATDVNNKTNTSISQENQHNDKSLDSDVEGDRDNMTIIEYIRTFFNSLSLYTSDTPSEENYDELNETDEVGYVTISTIHGAKGLEWPVVFIPGCVEGIIPSIFSKDEDDDADRSDDDNTDNDVNNSNSSNNSSSNLKRSKNTDVLLDEERRMFFVAQTRAKILLYVSSVEDSNNPMFGGPSRFLTNELLQTLVDEQKVFESPSNIKALYRALKKPLPTRIKDDFSFKQLIKDYSEFVSTRREKMIWCGRPVINLQNLNIKKNKMKNGTSMVSEFSTAAEQLKIETKLKSPKKKYAPSYSPIKQTLGKDSQRSPVRKYAPTSRMNLTPSPTKTYAPSNYKMNTPANKSLFVPDDESPFRTTAESTEGTRTTEGQSLSFSNANAHKGSLNKKFGLAKPLSFKGSSTIKPQGNRDMLKGTIVKKENDTQNISPIKIEDITAAEVLHNPDDLTIDNRPIIANAKILADAITKPKKMTKKKKASNLPTQANQKDAKAVVKTEPKDNKFDIFSQLSRAKKKAKSNHGEIIIIDD